MTTNPSLRLVYVGRESARFGPPWLVGQWRKALSMSRAQGKTIVPVAAINADPKMNPRRDGVDDETAQRYAENLSAMPPLIVQKNTLLLLDGWHRLEAAKLANLIFVEVQELPIGDDECFLIAAGANVAHGRALPLSDRLSNCRRLLLERPDLPNTRISGAAGVSTSTVANERKSIYETGPVIVAAREAVSIANTAAVLKSHPRQWAKDTEESSVDDEENVALGNWPEGDAWSNEAKGSVERAVLALREVGNYARKSMPPEATVKAVRARMGIGGMAILNDNAARALDWLKVLYDYMGGFDDQAS